MFRLLVFHGVRYGVKRVHSLYQPWHMYSICVQYLYSICTLPKRTYTVHILYKYCTYARECISKERLLFIKVTCGTR